MSLKSNILANYASQLYVTLVGIVTIPTYIHYMGIEAYGLVGIFSLLQILFNLLDVGLTPTMARETARFKGGAVEGPTLLRLLHTLEFCFVVVGILATLGIAAAAPYIASEWLKGDQLPAQTVEQCIQVMGLIAAVRFLSALYRGAITGLDRQVWVGGVNALIATLRNVAVIPIIAFVSARPQTFFQYQLLIAAIELLILLSQVYRFLPKPARVDAQPFKFSELKGSLHFAGSMSFVTIIWVMITQADKFILSGMLKLDEYACYTMATLVAGAVATVTRPLTSAQLPRLTRLHAEGSQKQLLDFYNESTQLVASVVVPVVMILSIKSELILWAWTGDRALSQKVSPVLSLYVLGNGLMTLAGLPFLLQYAKGELSMHIRGNIICAVGYLPLVIFATLQHGMIGAALAWASFNALMFFAWVPIVHRALFPGLHGAWIKRNFLALFLVNAVFIAPLMSLNPHIDNRLVAWVWISFELLLSFALGVLALPELRAKALGMFFRLQAKHEVKD